MLIAALLMCLCLALCATSGDRDNFSGDITVTAPTGGYTRGKMYAVENSHVVARQTVDAAASCLVALRGPVWVDKVTGTGKSLAKGQKIYFVAASNAVSPSATGNTLLAATVLEAAAAADTSALITLDGPSPALT